MFIMASILIRIFVTISLSIVFGFLNQVSLFRIIVSSISTIFVTLFISWKLANKLSSIIKSQINPVGKVCLITGCDTGFGRAVSVEIAKRGMTVFAGCLNPDSLRGISSDLHPIKLDVTVDEEIINAHLIITNFLIRHPEKRFWSLINNAGISNFSAIEWGSTDEIFTKLFQVNVIGCIKLTRVFLPLIKAMNHSRIVFMSSYSSRVSFPGMVPYSMTKAAIKSFADGLRREIEGVKVVVIEPSMYRTPLTKSETCWNNFQSNWMNTPNEVKSTISELEREFIREKVTQYLSTVCERSEEVINTVIQSIMSISPLQYYFIYSNLFTNSSLSIIKYLPEEIVDLILTLQGKVQLFNQLLAKRRKKEN